MHEINNKTFFKNYAFFLVILLVIFSILSYSTYHSRKSWNKNLATSIQKVLDEYQSSTWKIESAIPVKSPVSVNTAAYQVRNKIDGTVAKAVMVRITTFYGPLPAVFIYREGEDVEFAGYASLHGIIKMQLENTKSDKRREYWESKVPEILN